MQSKFTRRSLVYFLTRLGAIALILVCSTMLSYSQKKNTNNQFEKQKVNTSQFQYKKAILQGRAGTNVPKTATNDAGIATRNSSSRVNRTEAVCQTYVGALTGGDATMGSRLSRPGAPTGSCAAAYTVPATIAGGPFAFDTYTYTNTTGLTQCGTFTLTTNDVANANIQFGIYNGSFNPANLLTNYIADPGLSTGTPAPPAGITALVTINSGQTIVLVVFSTNPNTAPSGLATDYTLTVSFPVCSSAPCSGTPAPGNTLSTVTTACSGIPFTLSLQNPTAGSGVSYQWQSSASATGPWNPIGAATGSTLTTTQTAATWYRCNVTCSAGPTTTASNPVQVLLTPASGCYCIPPVSDCTLDDEILNVTISTLNNTSSGCSGVGYTNYTALPAPNIFSGAVNPISVTIGPGGADDIGVWIDYDHSGSFEPSEFTLLASGIGGGTTTTGNINIPVTALGGNTRMRVRVGFLAGFTGGDACTGYTFSETEDYTVNIVPCVPVTITTPPANASITCGGNASFTVATAGSGPSYSWQYRTSAAGVWQTVTNGGIYSGVTTATLTLTNVSQAFTGYQYRALVTGACSAVDFSAPATLTVTAVVPIVNPASASICLGSVQQLSLTNTVSTPTTVTFNTTGLPSIIPDNDLTGVQKSIVVSGIPTGAIITNIAVKLDITHAFVGDLVLNLKSPTNQVLNMFALLDNFDGSNGTANFTGTVIDALSTTPLPGAPAPRTGTFKPEAWQITGPANFVTNVTSFAPMLGANPNGTWNLLFADAFAGDQGTITSLSLLITYTAPAFAQGTWTGPAGTMYTNAAATPAFLYTGTPATTIYVKPTAAGVNNYNVSFTSLTPCTSATTTVPVTVSTPVTGVVNPANKSACVGNTATFTVSATGGPITYQWQVSSDGALTWTNIAAGGTAASYTTGPVTQLMNNYQYRAVLTGGPCGSVNSGAATLTVNPLPIVSISAPDLALTPGQTTTITATSNPAAANYAWTRNGTSIFGPNTNTRVAGIDSVGAYRVTVTDVNGCVNNSNTLVIGSEASDRLWIYPNPTTGAFQVRLYFGDVITENRFISIYDQDGRVVMTKEVVLTNISAPYTSTNFDLSKYPAGVYVVKVAHKHTGKITSGLVIKHSN